MGARQRFAALLRSMLKGMIDPRVEEYAAEHTTPPGEELGELMRVTHAQMPNPGMASGLLEARLLEALVAISGARRVLEVGTFTGVGTLAMAAALPADGELVTIEFNEQTAALARSHVERSPWRDRIRLIEGDAREEIERLEGPFDLVFIDAWKPDYEHYYEAALARLSPRGMIVADNVLWRGKVLDPDPDDAQAQALARFNEHVQRDQRVRNVLLPAGDGLMLVWRADASAAS